jgi:glycosyltransferase involved in cell wall biosynthesis
MYYKAADCFILPTTEDNWSLVVPEAMACGLPIATTIYNGCHPELVHPENGWVFDSLNPKSIEETLLDIYAKKDELSEMGKASQQIVANETAERAAKSIMDAIEIAINRKR